MRWGKSLDALRLYEKRTGTTPKALLEQPPDPPPDTAFYLNAFRLLSNFRGSNGFAIEPLRYADMAHYAAQMGLEGDEFFFFAEVIAAIDHAYRNAMSESQPKTTKKPVPAPSGPAQVRRSTHP